MPEEEIMKTRFLITLCTAMVVGATLIAAPVIAADMANDKALINDSFLTAKTKIALAADTRVHGRQVKVETQKGLVFIRGKVDSDEAKKAAEEIARGIEGVKDVKNDLTLKEKK